MKIWIIRKTSYFIGILSGVEDIFLPSYPQNFFLLNVKFKDIFEPYKNLVQKEKSFSKSAQRNGGLKFVLSRK